MTVIQVVYFTGIFPYIVLVALLIAALTNEGAVEGLVYFFKPKWHKLWDPIVWYRAVEQSFFSLGVCFGSLTMYASYNSFKNNVYRDAIIISVLDTFTSILAGCVIFAVLGSMAFKQGKPIETVVEKQGLGLAFVAYPEALSQLKFVPQLWSILFFIMLYTLGLGSSVAQLETILTCIRDEFSGLMKRKKLVAALACTFFCLCGLPLTTNLIFIYGNYQLFVLGGENEPGIPDWGYAIGWALAAIAIFQIPLWIGITIAKKSGNLKQKLVKAFSPASDWGPSDPYYFQEWLKFNASRKSVPPPKYKLKMAVRSHFESFVLMRNNAQKHRQFSKYDENDDDEQVKLVGNDDAKFSVVDIEEQDSPSWVSLVDEFRYECTRLKNKIDSLKEEQVFVLKQKATLIFDDDTTVKTDSSEAEIETKSQEIGHLFGRLHGLIQETRAIVSISRESKILKNILQWQYKEISKLSNEYRECQKDYVNGIQTRDKYTENFIINFDDVNDFKKNDVYDGHIIYDTADEEISVMHSGDQQQLLQAEYVETDLIRERETEMSAITKSIVELNEVFREINTMVVSQGSLMDRIDYNIESVQIKVEQGAIQIGKAERSARNARKIKCIMAMAGTILMALIVLILQT
ncbi:Sodium- and chloride-dependent glycine transporter 1 [Halotydeus destructor]|nr:Sodium- and chloride-dependent glycine transporter 1 [Halotydeus destructor]